MTIDKQEISSRKPAIIAGCTYLIMFAVAIIVEAIIRRRFIVPGDAVKTSHNILANEMLFRVEICHHIVIYVCDLIVAWALYVFLKQVNNNLAILAAWLRMIYMVISSVVLINKINILHILTNGDYSAVFGKSQIYAQVMLYLDAFKYGWRIGFVFFGIHIFILGYLILKSSYVPRILGILFMIVAFGFLINSFASFLLPDYKKYEKLFRAVVGIPSFFGEISFAFWLLLKGGKPSVTTPSASRINYGDIT
ncbi:MAG: DUF4386 domain-containing protein [Sporocytophaga sp.]|uniref:DUF4386 domain-containing protein n=1 Tax=Sporocytophaga sp. TaxID=2231183 RepID=UPI001B08B6ED|nr:DUF4386 domain-containing protein [Sporocytophaga sp.]MBO9699901.1 DUF4386 domain-containing protein [Sporocytophaga sp.]